MFTLGKARNNRGRQALEFDNDSWCRKITKQSLSAKMQTPQFWSLSACVWTTRCLWPSYEPTTSRSTQSRPVLNSVVVMSQRDIREFASQSSRSNLTSPSDEDEMAACLAERYQARSQSLSLRTSHDFSMCTSQPNLFSCNIVFFRGRWASRFSSPMRIRPEFPMLHNI